MQCRVPIEQAAKTEGKTEAEVCPLLLARPQAGKGSGIYIHQGPFACPPTLKLNTSGITRWVPPIWWVRTTCAAPVLLAPQPSGASTTRTLVSCGVPRGAAFPCYSQRRNIARRRSKTA